MDKELLALADDIATHPEIGFEEKRSVSKLTDYLRQHNFSVETGTAGLSTAFVAKFSRTTAARCSASSSSTTRCAAPRARSTAISTARRDRSAWRRRSRWPSTSPAPKRRAASSSTARPAKR